MAPETPSTPPAAWAGRSLWPYAPALGMLIAVEYSDTPVGPYSELLFVLTDFDSQCATPSPNSILRIWVSLPATYDAGRRIWGIPKELATFTWTSTDNSLGVTVTETATNSVILDATTHDSDIPISLFTDLLPNGIMPTSFSTVHWPINDNAVRNVSGSVPAYSVAEQAFAEGRALTTQVHVTLDDVEINTLTSAFVNQTALTGHEASRTTSLNLLDIALTISSQSAANNWSIAAPSFCS